MTDDINRVLDEFHSAIFKMLKLCKKIEPNNMEVEWLNNKLALGRKVDPFMIMERCKDKIWTYRDQILERNEDFFLNNKFSKFIKNDENKTFMYTLVNLMKKRFVERSAEEKEMIWTIINTVLICVIQYKKMTNDYVLS